MHEDDYERKLKRRVAAMVGQPIDSMAVDLVFVGLVTLENLKTRALAGERINPADYAAAHDIVKQYVKRDPIEVSVSFVDGMDEPFPDPDPPSPQPPPAPDNPAADSKPKPDNVVPFSRSPVDPNYVPQPVADSICPLFTGPGTGSNNWSHVDSGSSYSPFGPNPVFGPGGKSRY